jgi:parallel beta-helix repeat protein
MKAGRRYAAETFSVIVVFIAGLAFPSAAVSATYYVATSGNDGASCAQAQTLTTPKRTIAAGMSCARAGDRVSIRGGSYPENIDSNRQIIPTGSSWADAPVIAAYAGETVSIRNMNLAAPSGAGQSELKYVIFDGLRMSGSGTDAVSFWGAAHHIRLQNCEAYGATGERMGMNLQPGPGGGGYNEIVNCRVYGNGDCSVSCSSGMVGHGVYVATSNNLIDGLESYNNGHLGLQIYSEKVKTNNNIVRNSVFHHNGKAYTTSGAAIAVGTGDNNLIYNNVIFSNYGGIEAAYSGTNTKIYNNTIYNSRDFGIEIRNTSGASVRNNIVYQSGTPINNSGSSTVMSNNLTTDPRFVNASASDFRLQSASPAVDAGMTLAAVTDDIMGVARPQYSAFDIGAYELGGSSSLPAAPTNVRFVTQ